MKRDCHMRTYRSKLRERFAPFVLACVRVAVASLLWDLGAVAQLPSVPQPQQSVAQIPLDDARQLIEAGKYKQASTELKAYLVTEDGSASAHDLLANCYLLMDDPKDSLQEYTRAAKIEHPSALDLQNVAKDYVLLNDLPDAEHWATASLQMNERDAESWYVLGRIRFTTQRFQQAAECFERSLALFPRSVKAENNLGLSYEGLNRMGDAQAAYRQAIAWQQADSHPSEQPLLNLGIVLLHEEKLGEAKDLLTKAVAIAPNDPRIREQLGHLYLLLNSLPEAEAQLRAAVALEPNKPALHFLLGKVYHQEGHEEKAKAEFAASAALSGYHSTSENP
jgi:Tfp pilus assembly protein PilF